MTRGNFQDFCNKYQYIDISEDVLKKIYDEAILAEDVASAFHKLIIKYLNKNMTLKTLVNYINRIDIDLSSGPLVISKKLATFFKFIDNVNYVLTPEDAITLIDEPVFQALFKAKFSSKSISNSALEKYVGENQNLELLCRIYLEKNNIEITEDSLAFDIAEHKGELLNTNQEKELFIAVQNGDNLAIDKLVKANLGLVRLFARRYCGKGLEYDDLYQEGSIGLVKAIEKFDYNKGYAFSTYAMWWIRQAITRALAEKARTIRMPVHAVESLNKIRREIANLKISLNREPEISEIAKSLNLKEDTVKKLLENDRSVISLNHKLKTDEDDELGDFLQIDDTNVEEEAINTVVNENFINAVKTVLTEKQFKVVAERFGLYDNCPKTLEVVGSMLGVTRERIRQIEVKALKKLSDSRLIKSVSDENVSSNYYIPEKQKQQMKKEDNNPATQFDINTINKYITFEIFEKLLMMFPERDINIFTKYNSINFKRKEILYSRKGHHDEKVVNCVKGITKELKEMYKYYETLTEKRHIEPEEAYKRVKARMESRYLKFKFINYSYREIVNAVNQLPPTRRAAIYKKHGENLLEYHEIKGKNFYQTTFLAYKDMEAFLLNPNAEHKNSFLAKYRNKSFAELNDLLAELPSKYRDIIYLRHGKTLKECLPFPKDKKYQTYYNMYNKAISLIDGLLNGEEIVIKESKSLLSVYNLEDLLYAAPKLKSSDRELLYIIHGENMNQNNEFPLPPEDKHPYYYKQRYYGLFTKIDRILKKREANKKENEFIKKLGDYTYLEVIAEINLLDIEERKIILIRHGETLEEFNPFPTGKPLGYYKNIYNNAIYNLKNNLMLKKFPEEFEMQKRRKEEIESRRQEEKLKHKKTSRREKSSVLNKFSKEDILWAIEYISDAQKEILFLRHGENLDKTISWKVVSEGKKTCNCYATYYNMSKKLADVINNREKYEKIVERKNKKVRTTRISIINEIDHERLVEIVSMLSEKQQQIMYLRHGKELDQIIAFPKNPEDKCANYYYVLYSNAIKKINLINSGQELPKRPSGVKVSKNNIINVISHEDLIYAYQLLSEKEKTIFSIRHGENLDQVLAWPDEKKSSYYVAYAKIIKKIREILEEKNNSKKDEPKKEKESGKKKKHSKKEVTETSNTDKENMIREKRSCLFEVKNKLEEVKINNYAATLYEKYYSLYNKQFSGTEIKDIIRNAINSYSYDDGISLELATTFKIESNIILELANRYKSNPNSEESLEILLLIEELFGMRIKAKYTNTMGDMPYCYLSDELVSLAIEETLLSYTGKNPFYTDLCLKIKRTL